MKDAEDWETMIWFLIAHNLRIDNAHEKRLTELKSTIETMDTELAALASSYISACKRKRAFAEEIDDERADPKWQTLCRELDRVAENFKQRINAMG
jgi:hypothetical protein